MREDESAAERLGAWLYRASLRLLPRDLVGRAGDEMVEVFRARHRSAVGVAQCARAWVHELVGVIVTAIRVRLSSSHTIPGTQTDRRRRGSPMEWLAQDVRYAVRAMSRRPGMTALAVFTFGLGIAASTAMFSVVNAVLLRPLPFPASDRIVSLYTRNPEYLGHPTMAAAAERGWWSYPEFREIRESGRDVLDGAAALSTEGGVIYSDGEPERIPLGLTTPDLFARVLRVGAIFGRVFDEEDARTGENVILLTEGFWRRHFGADPDVVGSALRLGDSPFTIIGVLPQEAHLSGYDVAAWTLIRGDENWANHWLLVIGRLAGGVTPDQASARLSPVLEEALPADQNHAGVSVFARQADDNRGVRGPLWLLALASVVLLAVACGNVAGLLVGAAIDREQELAVRAALGAGRRRLIRQLLTESAILGLASAIVGVVFAGLATRALTLIAPEDVPRIASAGIDGQALGFAVVTAIACSLIFGLIPALTFSRTNLRNSMNAATRGSTGDRGRLQGIVVAGELALATLLLVGGGLLARTVLALNAVDPGFAASETLSLRLSVPASRLVADVSNDSARNAAVDAYYRTVVERVEAIAGVRGVAITSNLPLSPDRGNNGVRLEGYDEEVLAERRFVSPNYFDVMGIRIIEGESFSVEQDQPGAAGSVVISEGLARLAWPNESAVGKRFEYWGRETTVVGVAADVNDEELQGGTTFAIYTPRRQANAIAGTFVVRTTGDPVAYVPAIRQRIREIHDDIAIIAVQPLSELVSDEIASQRYRARLVLVFAVLAALFSLMGIYGVTARNVAARTRELGIRKALGARREGIIGLVLGQAVRLAAVGALLGIAVSFIATRWMEAYLWGVDRMDPVTLISIGAFLAFASIIAALAPGLRAARVDPMEALRDG